MFTHIVRRRVVAVLTAGAAAAAVLALAAPAGAVTGARQTSPEMAGYTANHAQFSEVEGYVYLRDPAQYAGMVARYGHSVQLWSADRVVSLNFTASTSGEEYTPSVTIYDRSTHQVIASNPHAQHIDGRSDSWHPGVGGPYTWGDQVGLKIHYYPADGVLHMFAGESMGPGYAISWSYQLPGQSFTKARIGTAFGSSPWDASYTYTAPAKPAKAAAYTAVLTSYSGHRDGLSSWWVHHNLLAQPPGRGRVAAPHDLTNGGYGFQTWFAPKSAQRSS
jgi:hypothetical protein